LARAVSRLLDVLAPPGCAACDASCGATFCEVCGVMRADTQVHELDGVFGGVPLVVAGEYAAPLSTAITRFKYAGRPELSRSLAPLLLSRMEQLHLPADVVLVPVPLHPRRLATRGYNQAALLAQELAGRCRWACEPRFLRRARETERQVGKSRTLRLTNARGAFEQRRPGPARVVLVDDVVTTGSTVRACAQALADGGATLVAIAALARARAA
jgi:ComF family protein